MRKHKNAFTLVELLVVVAIIALLISILLPSLSQARRSARTTVCASNQRQILIAITMYASEYRDLWKSCGGVSYDPPVVVNGVTAPLSGGKVLIAWFDVPLMGQYLHPTTRGLLGQWPYPKPAVMGMYCPESLSTIGSVASTPDYRQLGIGFNNYWNCQIWSDKNGPTNLNAMTPQAVLLADCESMDGSGKFWPGNSWNYYSYMSGGIKFDYSNNPITNTSTYQYQGFNSYRHGVCNVGFADGHVAAIDNVVKANTRKEINIVVR